MVATMAAADAPSANACLIDRNSSPSFDAAGCEAAITAEQDAHTKAALLERRAYAKDESHRYDQYQSALDDLHQALELDPNFGMAYHERAYIENELGDFQQAEGDLDAQAKLMPNDPQLYDERALSRFLQGKLQGAFEDRDRKTELAPNEAGARLARAEALMWLGRFAEASRDIDTGTAMAQAQNDASALGFATELRSDLARWQTTDDAATAKHVCAGAKSEADFLKETFIGDCTRAFLSAATNPERADALTQRYTAIELWKQRRGEGLNDLRLAYAFDPDNPDHALNLGGLLNVLGRNHESLKYLNIAVAKKPSGLALAERASAEHDLGDFRAAFLDAKKSFETEPNEIGLTVLGDLAYEQMHDSAAAKTYWLGAYHLGDRDDGLKGRLEKIGVAWPPTDAPADSK